MQSKTSFFNGTLFAKNIKRYWPMWGLVTFGGLLLPLTFIVGTLNDYSAVTKKDDIVMFYGELISGVLPILSMIYSILVAMAVWNYMYTSKSINFFHAIPVSRKSLFVSSFLSGIVMILIPYVPAGIVMSIFSGMNGVFAGAATLKLIWAILCESVFFFGLATIIAHITGNILALPVLYVVFNFLEVGVSALVELVITSTLYGVNFSRTRALDFLSPVVYLMMNVTLDYRTIEVSNYYLVSLYGLAGVVLTIVAYAAYAKRKSETASETVSIPVLKNIIHIAFTIIAAIAGGLFLCALFNNFYFETMNMVTLCTCIIVAGIIAYYIGAMIMERTVKVFSKKKLLPLLGCSVFYVLFCLAVKFDICNIERYVPDFKDVEWIDVSVGGNNVQLYPGQDDELINQIIGCQQYIIANEDQFSQNYRNNWSSDENYYYSNFYITYTLKDGREISRNYYVSCPEEDLYNNPIYAPYLNLSNTPELLVKLLHSNDGYKIDYMYVNIENNGESTGDTIEGNRMNTIRDAIFKDAMNGNWRPCDNSWKEVYSNEPLYIYINMEFTRESKSYYRADYSYTSYEYVDVYVTSKMTNTIAALKDAGLLKGIDI